MRYLIFILLPVLALITTQGCNVPEEVEHLEEEVMAIHDSIMPDMPIIHKQKKDLETWINEDSLVRKDSVLIKEIKSAMMNLKIAEDEMWRWMHEYQDRTEEINQSDKGVKLDILEEEKDKIIRVRDLMIASMNKGDSLLNIKNTRE